MTRLSDLIGGRTTLRRVLFASVALLGLTACTDSFVPQFVDDIRLSPDSVHISAGDRAVFRALPVDVNGNELPERSERVQWSVNRSDVATIGGTVGESLEVTALTLGDARLTASLGRGTIQGRVFVQPPGLDRIEIQPSSLTVPRGQRPRVEVFLYDAQGLPLDTDGFRISWAIVDPQIGFVGTPTGPRADLLARRVGRTSVRVIVGNLSAAIPFVVQ